MDNISTISLAALAGVDRTTAIRWARSGKIHSTRDHAGRWIIKRADAEAFVAARKLVGPKPAGERND